MKSFIVLALSAFALEAKIEKLTSNGRRIGIKGLKVDEQHRQVIMDVADGMADFVRPCGVYNVLTLNTVKIGNWLSIETTAEFRNSKKEINVYEFKEGSMGNNLGTALLTLPKGSGKFSKSDKIKDQKIYLVQAIARKHSLFPTRRVRPLPKIQFSFATK